MIYRLVPLVVAAGLLLAHFPSAASAPADASAPTQICRTREPDPPKPKNPKAFRSFQAVDAPTSSAA